MDFWGPRPWASEPSPSMEDQLHSSNCWGCTVSSSRSCCLEVSILLSFAHSLKGRGCMLHLPHIISVGPPISSNDKLPGKILPSILATRHTASTRLVEQWLRDCHSCWDHLWQSCRGCSSCKSVTVVAGEACNSLSQELQKANVAGSAGQRSIYVNLYIYIYVYIYIYMWTGGYLPDYVL